jgi:hypothetical protein
MTDTVNVAGPMVTGLFRDRPAAERAFRSAQSLGYAASDISVIMSDETREREFEGKASALAQKAQGSAPESSPAAEELGGPTGGTVGTIAPVIAAIGTVLLIPGLGLAAAGPVAIALTAAGAVGVAGGVIGALTKWGVPKSRVEEYEAAVRKGGILLGVSAKSSEEAEKLSRVWTDAGGAAVRSS